VYRLILLYAVRVSDAVEFGASQAAALSELKQICCCLDHIPVICLYVTNCKVATMKCRNMLLA